MLMASWVASSAKSENLGVYIMPAGSQSPNNTFRLMVIGLEILMPPVFLEGLAQRRVKLALVNC